MGQVSIYDGRPVRPEQAAARRVDIRASPLQVGCEVVDHGVHIAGGYAQKQSRLAQAQEVLSLAGLGDDAHAVAGIPEHPAHKGGGKRGMVDIGVSADEYDVQLIDALLFCLRPEHGQKGRLRYHAL